MIFLAGAAFPSRNPFLKRRGRFCSGWVGGWVGGWVEDEGKKVV